MKKEIVIDRSKWRTGVNGPNCTGKGQTLLLNNEGYKCCLGFICQQVTKKKIKNFFSPKSVRNNIEWLCKNGSDTNAAYEAMEINDDPSTTPEHKEKAIKKLFKDSPYKLVFKGKFTKREQL